MAIQVQGRRLSTGDLANATPLPRRDARGNSEFRFGVLPGKAQFYEDKGEFLPQINHVQLTPGVNGVQAGRAGPDGRVQVRTGILENLWRSKGGVLVDPGDRRLGEFFEYIQVLRNDAGHPHHRTILERYERVGKKVYWYDDPVLFRRLQHVLVDSGICEPVHPATKQAMTERQAEEVSDIENRLGSKRDDGLMSKLDKARRRLWAMENERPASEWPGAKGPALTVAPTPDTPAKASPKADDRATLRKELSALRESHSDGYANVVPVKARPANAGVGKLRTWITAIQEWQPAEAT